MGAPSRLGKSERQAVVLALLRREEPAGVLARRCRVSEKTLYSWRDVFLEARQVALVRETSESYPWYGYQTIAVICRRTDPSITDRQSYQVMRMYDLLHKRVVRAAAVHQTRKPYELLPQYPSALWQMDVTYVCIPGYGWWYAITVIDYYSRYLLACRLTWSDCAIEAMVHPRRRTGCIHWPT